MILVEERGQVGVIWLDRPERRNALTPSMLDALAAKVLSIAKGCRALVLAGKGEVFCAGFDLSLCRDDPGGTELRHLLTGLSNALVALNALSIPVVAAAHGAAIAGGCALLGGADIVVSDVRAKLGYPVTRLGISPAVSAPFLMRSLSAGRAREWLLGPTLKTGEEAAAAGLVHSLAPSPEQVVEVSLRLASELASKPAGGLQATKSWLAELAAAEVGSEWAGRSAAASLALVGGEEERELLPRAWER